MPFMKVDAGVTVVEAALRGYMRWVASHGSTPQQDVCEIKMLRVGLY
jgi:exportin-5